MTPILPVRPTMDPLQRTLVTPMHARFRSATTFPSIVIAALVTVALPALAGQIDLHGPAGSRKFGGRIAALPNGNVVVVDSDYAVPGQYGNGAVYLYDRQGTLLSSLVGKDSDFVGLGGVKVLSNGDFLVCSGEWSQPGLSFAGAVTYMKGDGSVGIGTPVTPANSLVGGHADDAVGSSCAGILESNSHQAFLIRSYYWHDGTAEDVGAVTLGRVGTPITGVVTVQNSIVGSSVRAYTGSTAIALAHRDFVIKAGFSDAGGSERDLVTWIDEDQPTSGYIDARPTIRGAGQADRIGELMWPLANGNYVVHSSYSAGNGQVLGSLTFAQGGHATDLVVSPANSLVGSTQYDNVGNFVVPLSNGDYVVVSPDWSNGAAAKAGAVTYASGSTGIAGPVSAANSLVGGSAGDQLGTSYYGYRPMVTELAGGRTVVASPRWHRGAASVGAATLCPVGGCIGLIDGYPSLSGSADGDFVGASGVVALPNGAYVVASDLWANGALTHAGAVTWCDPIAGCNAQVGVGNSLVGSYPSDFIGGGNNEFGVTRLANGNYVVASPYLRHLDQNLYGAATWAPAGQAITGVVDGGNSIVGARIGSNGAQMVSQPDNVIALANGNYVLDNWVEWGSGGAPTVRVSQPCGSTGLCGKVRALANGNYLVTRSSYTDPIRGLVGAVMVEPGDRAPLRSFSAERGVIGSTPVTVGTSVTLVVDYSDATDTLVVGQPLTNIASIYVVPLFASGFED